jgi:hypothetical protein
VGRASVVTLFTIFLERGGLFIAADSNIAQFHLVVVSLLLVVDLIVQELIAGSKKMNIDKQMTKRIFC